VEAVRMAIIDVLPDDTVVGRRGAVTEVNALLFATRDTKGTTAYITDPPCPGCRKALAAAGIIRAVWPEGEYDVDGLVDWSTPA
jgi:deoxycytidylate deaminase